MDWHYSYSTDISASSTGHVSYFFTNEDGSISLYDFENNHNIRIRNLSDFEKEETYTLETIRYKLRKFYLKKVIPIKVNGSQMFAILGAGHVMEGKGDQEHIHGRMQICALEDGRLNIQALSAVFSTYLELSHLKGCRGFIEKSSSGNLLAAFSGDEAVYLLRLADISGALQRNGIGQIGVIYLNIKSQIVSLAIRYETGQDILFLIAGHKFPYKKNDKNIRDETKERALSASYELTIHQYSKIDTDSAVDRTLIPDCWRAFQRQSSSAILRVSRNKIFISRSYMLLEDEILALNNVEHGGKMVSVLKPNRPIKIIDWLITKNSFAVMILHNPNFVNDLLRIETFGLFTLAPPIKLITFETSESYSSIMTCMLFFPI